MLTFDAIKHEYWWVNDDFTETRIPSVSQLIRLSGLGPDYSMVKMADMERARRRGIKVHKLTDQHDKGIDPDLFILDADIYDDGMRMLEAYLKFKDDHNVTVLASEEQVCYRYPGQDRESHPYYAGTLDKRTDDRVIDLKCTSGIHDTYGLQAWMYRGCFDGEQAPPIVLRLANTGKYFMWELKEDPIWDNRIDFLINRYWSWEACSDRRGLTKIKSL